MGLFDSIFGTGQTSKTKNIPAWLGPLLKQNLGPAFENLTGQASTPSPLAAQGDEALSDTVGGKFLDPAAQAIRLQPTIDAITGTSREYLQRAIGGSNDQAARSGGLFSTKLNLANNDLVRRSTQDVTNRVADVYSQDYNRERGIQANSIPLAMQQRYGPLDEALRIVAALTGTVQSNQQNQTPSLFSGLQQGAASTAGLLLPFL